MRRRLVALASSIALVGCAQGGGGTDPDAGVVVRLDAGSRMDATPWSPPDGGRPTDAYVARDGGGTGGEDAGTSPRCVGVDCSHLDGLCTRGFCVPDTGACSTGPAPAGAACDDGDPCTTDDQCVGAGLCDGTPMDCSAADTACGAGTCNPTTGACETTPVADGTDCDGDPTD